LIIQLTGGVLAGWTPRQFSGPDKVLYAKRMFRELLLYIIYLVVLCCGTFVRSQDFHPQTFNHNLTLNPVYIPVALTVDDTEMKSTVSEWGLSGGWKGALYPPTVWVYELIF